MRAFQEVFGIFIIACVVCLCGVAAAAPPTFTISGIVATADGTGIEGVDIVPDGGIAPTVTAADGSYLITVPNHWDGSITVSKTGWLITPASRAYTNVVENFPTENYTAYQPKISGYVRKADGIPLSEAVVTANNGGGSGTTDASGYYEVFVPYTWSGTLRANKVYWFFEPIERLYTDILSDLNSQDFIATASIGQIIVSQDSSGNFDNIQAAIDVAVNGDTVIVKDGVYTGEGNRDISFLGKAITVTSANGPENCIIDCQGTELDRHRGFKFNMNEGRDSMLSGFTITNGYAPEDLVDSSYRYCGGAIYCYGSSPSIQNCIIKNNYSELFGGGIACAQNSDPLITNCQVIDNTADNRGGGIYSFYGCDMVIRNCVIANNIGSAAVYTESGGTNTLDHCTIVDTLPNSMSGSGTGISNNAGHMYVSNSIVWGNDGEQIYSRYDYLMHVSYSNVQGDWSGEGNISIDSDFKDNGYHLSANSPCKDMGDPSYTPEFGEVDIDGHRRIIGGRVDIGADEVLITDSAVLYINEHNFEFVAEGMYSDISPQTFEIFNDGEPDLIWHAENNSNWIKITPTSGQIPYTQPGELTIDIDPNNMHYGFQTGQFQIVAPNALFSPQTITVTLDVLRPEIAVTPSSINYEREINEPSIFTSMLLVSNSGHGTLSWQLSEECEWLTAAPLSGQCTTNQNEVTMTVNTEGLDIGFYHCDLIITAEGAFNSPLTIPVSLHVYRSGERHVPIGYSTIQAAINAAVDGDIVYVDDGMYTGDGNRDIDFLGKAITVRGNRADPNSVVIDCQGNWEDFHQGFIFASGEDANSVVEGLTIKNGYVWANHGGGIRCHSSSPTIQNCIITDNRSPSGGGIYCGYLGSPGSPIIKNCTIKNNVAYNSASGYGGGIYCNNSNALVKDCHIINNSANEGGGLYCWNDNLTIKNSFIAGNNGEHYGGAFYCAWSNTFVENCTIINNNAGADGGCIHSYTGCDSIIRNSIIWNNSQQQLYGGGNNVTYSNIQGGYTGIGNIDLDPLLESDSYHLSVDSPCINAGDPNYIADSNDVDIDGNLRIVGTRVDMGADEFSTDEPYILMPVSDLNFTALEARENPVPQTITFNNLGLTDLNWTAGSNVGWLQTLPVSGSTDCEQTASISIVPVIDGLPAGQFFGQISISDPNAINSPELVDVNLIVIGPSLGVSQTAYSFTASNETLNPEPQVLTISNTGGGTLSWSITPDCDWIQIEPASGAITTDSADVVLDIDQSNMEYGTYNCQLTVESPNASNSPQVVTVVLVVLRPEIEVSPTFVEFECEVDELNVLTQTLSISNSGYDTLNWQIAENCNWLSVSPVSGQCSTEPNEVLLAVDTTGLDIGFYNCQLTVTDENASNSPFVVPVSLHVYREGERHVPVEYPTIQQAIDAAVDGDHVIVHPGRYPNSLDSYYERVDYKGKAVTVRSIDPTNPEIVASTILDRGYVYFDQEEVRNSVLDGLTINGSVTCYNSSPVIRNCIFGEPMPTTTSSGSISIYQGNPHILNCTFAGMAGMRDQNGRSIYIGDNRYTAGDTIIENCLLSIKSSEPYMASSIQLHQAHANIVNTTIAYCLTNTDDSYPYLIFEAGLLIRQSDVSVKNSIVWGNRGSNDTQITIVNNNPDPDNPLNSHVDVSYSDIEGGAEDILIFPDDQAYYDYRETGNLPDPNLVDPDSVNWGPGNMDVDPLFVRQPDDGGDGWFPIGNPGAVYDPTPIYNNDFGDLHLKSQAGRFVWDGFARADFNLDKRVDLIDFSMISQTWQYHSFSPCDLDRDYLIDLNDFALFCDDYLQPRVFGAWVTDDVTSPCIDAGDPNDSGWQGELWPHGGRVNMGAYGGTPQASMSPNPVGNPADLNHDGTVNNVDWSLWADDWGDERILLDSDFDRNNRVDPNDMSIFLNQWLWTE